MLIRCTALAVLLVAGCSTGGGDARAATPEVRGATSGTPALPTRSTQVVSSTYVWRLADVATWDGVVTVTVRALDPATVRIESPRGATIARFCSATVDEVYAGVFTPGQEILVACAVQSATGSARAAGYSLPVTPWPPGATVDLALDTAEPQPPTFPERYPGYVAEPVDVSDGRIRLGSGETAELTAFARQFAAARR